MVCIGRLLPSFTAVAAFSAAHLCPRSRLMAVSSNFANRRPRRTRARRIALTYLPWYDPRQWDMSARIREKLTRYDAELAAPTA